MTTYANSDSDTIKVNDNTSSKDTLSPRDYVQHLYDTGNVIDNRPRYSEDIEAALKVVELTARNVKGMPLVIQSNINKYPVLKNLITPARGDEGEENNEDDEFDSHFLEFNDLRRLPKPEWLIYNILPTKGISIICGAPKCGKTFIAVSMACSVALQPGAYTSTLDAIDASMKPDAYNWCDLVTKHQENQHVVYIAGEDIDDVAQRITGWADYYNVKDLSNLHIFDCPLQLATDTPRFMKSLKKRYKDKHIALFVVDTLAVCSAGIEENSKKEFDAVLRSLEALWREYNCCVLVIHHTGRKGEIRGTSAMDGIAYSLMKAEASDENILLKSTFQRRGRSFEDIYLDRQIVETGDLDEMGIPATTCVVTKSGRVPETSAEQLTKFQQNIIDVIRALGGVHVARSDVKRECNIDKTKEKSFQRATKILIASKLMKGEEEGRKAFYTLQGYEGGNVENNNA